MTLPYKTVPGFELPDGTLVKTEIEAIRFWVGHHVDPVGRGDGKTVETRIIDNSSALIPLLQRVVALESERQAANKRGVRTADINREDAITNDKEEPMSDAMQRGYNTYQNGAPKTNNPYATDAARDSYIDFNKGWEEAHAEQRTISDEPPSVRDLTADDL